ncbi:hypothetical protein SAMN04488000_10313 [Lentzea albida]|uniref:Uncharacterized protein n=1 Tax=Lentzea albida TaxID=65499 RepID=A0A1H9G7D4_9PSEU|nr:hypothetical protein SAMN04488000_10313 [Lentzea albida]
MFDPPAPHTLGTATRASPSAAEPDAPWRTPAFPPGDAPPLAPTGHPVHPDHPEAHGHNRHRGHLDAPPSHTAGPAQQTARSHTARQCGQAAVFEPRSSSLGSLVLVVVNPVLCNGFSHPALRAACATAVKSGTDTPAGPVSHRNRCCPNRLGGRSTQRPARTWSTPSSASSGRAVPAFGATRKTQRTPWSSGDSNSGAESSRATRTLSPSALGMSSASTPQPDISHTPERYTPTAQPCSS